MGSQGLDTPTPMFYSTPTIADAAGAGIGIVAMKTMAGAFHDKERTQPIDCRAALKWVLQDENITTAIPGITTFEQLEQNASVNENIALTEEEKSHLALSSLEGGLYCQACEKCVGDCPRRLPIPELMRAYMYTYGYGDAAAAHHLLTGDQRQLFFPVSDNYISRWFIPLCAGG